MVLVVDLEEDEKNHQRCAPNRKVDIEDPTPSCVRNYGTSDEGAKGCANAVDR